MGASRWVYIQIDEITGETDAAFLMVLADGEEVWLPKSQIADADDYEKGDKDLEIAITEWIAEKKNLL